jgi:hypothetical protein
LELVASRLPLSVPSSSSLLEDLDGSFIFVAVGGHLNLRLLQLRLVLALFLAHDHVTLGKVSLDLQTVLLEAIPRFVYRSRLHVLGLQQFLDPVLNNLLALFDSSVERCKRLLQLALHLTSDSSMGLAHGLDFAADDIERHA